MVFIGKISYPLYLWHWPLIVLSRILFPYGSESIFANIIVVILISFVCSILTYFLIENKIRYHKSKKVTVFLILLMILIGFISLNMYLKQSNIYHSEEEFSKD